MVQRLAQAYNLDYWNDQWQRSEMTNDAKQMTAQRNDQKKKAPQFPAAPWFS